MSNSYAISECCKAFTIVSGLNIICTKCQSVIGQIEEDDDIMVGVVYNPNDNTITTAKNISFAPQLSQDPTCMTLNDHLCPKCKSPCKYILDASKRPTFICTNTDCRFVTNE